MKYIYSILALAILTGCGSTNEGKCCQDDLQDPIVKSSPPLKKRVTPIVEIPNLDLNDTIHETVDLNISKFICKNGNKVYLTVDEQNTSVIDKFYEIYVDWDCTEIFIADGVAKVRCEND